MKNCILINSYPNNDHKQNLLREQIKLLKSINLPIILCSGCEIPNDIVKEVNYVVINKNKRIKTALFQKKRWLEKKLFVCAHYSFTHSEPNIIMFNDFVDLTITENIKLLFNIAKFFGFENVVYTEDDNIFYNYESYFQHHLDLLNNKTYKMCATITDFGIESLGVHTNHFFSNIDFLLENFKFPHIEEELLDSYVLNELNPWKMYEVSIYNCFKNKTNDILNIDLTLLNKQLMVEKLFLRDNSIEYILDQRFTFLKKIDGSVCGYIKNTSNNLSFNAEFKSSRSCDKLINFGPNYWFMTTNLQFGDWISIEIIDSNGISYNKKIIYDSEDKILALQYY